ncbi:hypothetical protein SAMN05216596_103488 [Pseudomonas congelans]|uniref:Uncharacterized protein n=1 Tax=Pseudomonas congelans TaxID=200452 RepID=A0A0P9PRV0_9PSED|nr:hypothetical protein [Pseudomonas congelans]KPW87977.1 Uncharacterized protein ALO92_00211 [Pseudomonas congelans]QVX16270.1 hypothetical protein DB356_16935 [Pseudomonas congelans]SDP29895.1 hypothetical protein SAMN05216596_103488 [Pseudomonas congelans]
MHRPTPSPRRLVHPAVHEGRFAASINTQPFRTSSLTGRLTLRSELERAPAQWIWQVIADGRVGNRRTTIGLFLDRDLEPGDHDLIDHEQIKVIYNETLHRKNTVYHSAHFQGGRLVLLEASPCTLRLRGVFSFNMSSINLDVTDGAFDLYCR